MSADRSVAFHRSYLPRYRLGICSLRLAHALVSVTASLDEDLPSREWAGAGVEKSSSTARPNRAAAGRPLLSRASLIGLPHPVTTANPCGGLPLALDGVAHRLNRQAVSPDFRPAELPSQFLKPHRAGLLELAD